MGSRYGEFYRFRRQLLSLRGYISEKFMSYRKNTARNFMANGARMNRGGHLCSDPHLNFPGEKFSSLDLTLPHLKNEMKRKLFSLHKKAFSRGFLHLTRNLLAYMSLT